MHNHQVPDDAKEGLVLVHHQEVIHEAEVVFQSLSGEPTEPFCQELAPSPYHFLLLCCFCCKDLLADVMAGPVGHALRVISDIEEPLDLAIEVCQVEHTEELCNLDAQGSALHVTVYHLIDEVTQFAFLEFVRNLLFEDRVVHHREIMMDIQGDIISDVQLWIPIQLVPDEAEEGVCSQPWPYCWCSPGDIVIHLLFVWQDGSGLRMVVADGSLGQLPVLLIVNMGLLIALWHEGLVDDVGEYQTDILIKLCLVLSDVSTSVLAVGEVFEGIPCVLFRLILPTVFDSAHSRGLE